MKNGKELSTEKLEKVSGGVAKPGKKGDIGSIKAHCLNKGCGYEWLVNNNVTSVLCPKCGKKVFISSNNTMSI